VAQWQEVVAAMSHTRAYTVKIPPQWAGIDSARAQIYLREFFIYPLALPVDPGAGERAICLTLNEKLVSKLAEGIGEKPAVALRRLLAARIRELPAVSSSEPEARAIVPARPKTAEEKRGASPRRIEPPAWFDVENPNRVSYWRSLGMDCQLEMIEGHRAFEAENSGVAVKPLRGAPGAVLKGRVWFWIACLTVVFLYALPFLFSRRSGGSPASASRFSAWRPS
jgi:hypothetical protein